MTAAVPSNLLALAGARIMRLPPGPAGELRLLLELPAPEATTELGEQQWLSLRRAAAATGQSACTLRRLALDGTIPARRGARGAIHIRVGDVGAWIESRPIERAKDAAPEENPLAVAAARLRRRARRGGR